MKDPRDEIQEALQHQDFLERIDAIRGYDAAEKRLLDRLEAAESARRDDYQNWMTALDRNAELLAKLEAAEKNLSCCQAEREEAAALFLSVKTRLAEERDALRAAVRHEADCVEAAKAEIKALRSELVDLRSSMKFRTSLIGRTEAERDKLRAKIAEMEKQSPICRIKDIRRAHYMTKVVGLDPEAWLYALPGAKGEEK